MTPRGPYRNDPTLHFFLTRAVARAMGLNLRVGRPGGRVSATAYGEMIERCQTCPNAHSCAAWLSQHHDVAEAPPPGCRNTKAFLALKAKAP